jgi:hypothetical protein
LAVECTEGPVMMVSSGRRKKIEGGHTPILFLALAFV